MTITTSTANTAVTYQLSEQALAGFLIAHRGMRQEFGLLAIAARGVRDAEHAALIEDQVSLVSETLHKHHTAEDEEFWPRLRARAPEAAHVFDQLEAEHERIDPLLARATDRTAPLAERAEVFTQLHELLNAHLDLEEAVAVPLIPVHFTEAEWEALADRATSETSRRRMPVLFGWLASAGTQEQRDAALANVPAIPRVLFRLFWWPSYQRRARRLYGSNAPESVRS
jgi:iron-sulfur cluster repair protein YtfE (RIC family)